MTKMKLSRNQKRKQKKQQRGKRQKPADPNQRLIRRVRHHGFEQKIVRNDPEMMALVEHI